MKYRQGSWPNGSVKTSAIQFDAVGILHVGEKFAAFAKLGLARMYYKEGSDSGDKVTPHAGLGISYNFTPAVALRAEYDLFDKTKFGKTSYSLEFNSSQFSLGLDYHF